MKGCWQSCQCVSWHSKKQRQIGVCQHHTRTSCMQNMMQKFCVIQRKSQNAPSSKNSQKERRRNVSAKPSVQICLEPLQARALKFPGIFQHTKALEVTKISDIWREKTHTFKSKECPGTFLCVNLQAETLSKLITVEGSGCRGTCCEGGDGDAQNQSLWSHNINPHVTQFFNGSHNCPTTRG